MLHLGTPRKGSGMKKLASILSSLLTAIALVVGGTVLLAAPASAVSCYGDYCSGQDPDASGCSAGGITTKSWGNSSFILEVRWSPTCQTNWARLTMYPHTGCSPAGTLTAQQDTGYTQSRSIGSSCSSAGYTRWTPMIYSPVHHVRAKFATSSATYYTAWS